MLSQEYKKIVVRCACMFFAGTALQLFTGGIDASFLKYPWGLVLAANFLYLLVLISFNKDKWAWTEHFTGCRTYLSSLFAMLLLTLLFGVVPQSGSSEGVLGVLGYTQMTSSWVFNLFLLHFTAVIGVQAIDNLRNIKKHKLHVAIMHIAFFAILFAGVFGSGEKTRVRLKAVQGEPVNMGVTAEGKKVELPFIIKLKDFSLEEYPPQIHIYSNDNLSKEFLSINGNDSEGVLGGWHIDCVEYLDMAGRKPDDSVYVHMNHVGATTAAYIRATSVDETVEGWVSCGSFIFAGSTLVLPDGSHLVMPRREVKKYLSLTEFVNGDDKMVYNIAVNAPATIGAWKIYQSGYDSARGRWGTSSVFECVKDRWYPVTHVAMWLILAAGVFALLVNSIKNKNKR